ncbi:MAG TPA: coenzyme F420-0:L-glutamate ligase [Pseudolabrys sp.]|nr:coenzyme F420-0:L-glutamate ligase [Pseudolabrys sp.]
MTKNVSFVAVPGIPRISPGDLLASILIDAMRAAGLPMASGDVLVVAQKIVSKAEGRYIDLADVKPSTRAQQYARLTGKDPRLVEIVLAESTHIVRHAPNVLIVEHRHGFVMANAGVDQSNIEHPGGKERVLLLPENPDTAAAEIKTALDAEFGINCGVIINDSFGRPWRNGVTGVALGAAGFPSLLDMVGLPDMFGRKLQMTEIALADEVAAGASLVMGQAAEGLPAVLVRGLDLGAPNRPASALIRDRAKDLFR